MPLDAGTPDVLPGTMAREIYDATNTEFGVATPTSVDTDRKRADAAIAIGVVNHLLKEGGALNGYAEATAVSTTSAALEDITGTSFTLTTPASGRIQALLTLGNSTSGGAPAVGAWAISINGVDGTEIPRALSGALDSGMGAVQARSGVLAAGTYTVKGRHRRVSGAATVVTGVAQLEAHFVSE